MQVKVTKNLEQYPSWSKGAFTTCVVEARLILLRLKPTYLREQKEKLVESVNLQQANQNETFKQQINEEIRNNFFL